MKLEHLEYFSKIKPGLSLTTLSNQIHVSQQALSATIKVLESELECKLLERTRKGVQFTKEGEEFLFYTQAYLEKIREIKLKSNPLSGTLFLPIVPYIISGYLDKVIRRFMKENPDVKLNFFYSSSMKRNLEFLLTGEAEIVLGGCVRKKEHDLANILEYITINDCQFHVCFEVPSCIECHKDFAIRDNAFFLKELSEYDCVVFAYNADIINDSNDVQIMLDHCNCGSPVIYEWNKELYWERLLTKKCYGLSTYGYERNLKYHHDTDLVQLLPKDELNVQYGYVTKKEAELSPIAKRFVETMLF